MSATKIGNTVHDANMTAAENTRQVALAGTPTAAAVRNADIAFHRTGRASAIANGISPAQFVAALMELGTGGI
jgi:hypothetical protein